MAKCYCPFSYSEYTMKIGQDFFDIKYVYLEKDTNKAKTNYYRNITLFFGQSKFVLISKI